MKLTDDGLKVVGSLSKNPYPTFIVIILAISGLVYYFIVLDRVHELQKGLETCQQDNKALYNIIIDKKTIITKQEILMKSVPVTTE